LLEPRDLRSAGYRCQAGSNDRRCSSAPKVYFIEPDQRDLGRPVPWRKIFRLTRRANQWHHSPRPVPMEGRFANVTDVRRDAVDAMAAEDGRLQSGRRSRVVLTPRRWRQGRGAIRERRWQKSPVTGYRMHTSLLQSLAKTDSLVGIRFAEGSLMSMEIGLGRFGDRRLEKGGRRCMRPSFDVQAAAFDALQEAAPRRFGSRVFCAMKR
jgi:hypothetical protein